MSKGKNIVSERIYKTDPKFSSIGTTLSGGFALGSTNGEIRLYKEGSY